jgi:hypothetical protein
VGRAPDCRTRPRPRKFGLQGGVADRYRVAQRIGPRDNSYTLGGTRFFEDDDEDQCDCQELIPTVSKRALRVFFSRFGASPGYFLPLLSAGRRRDNERDLTFRGMGSEVFSNF